VLIVTADHGEAFGEHGMQLHGADLWEVLLRVPLLIHAPGAAPVRIRAARSAIDLAPTIVDLMGLPVADSFRGHSLSRELYGAAPEARAALLFSLCEDSQNPGFRGIISGDDKLIVPEAEGAALRLFNLKQDPNELLDLSERRMGKQIELSVREEREFESVPSVEPFGGMKLHSGRIAQGSDGPSRAGSVVSPPGAPERPSH
jgi:arylsulfatase A-like enzyme